MRRAWWFAFAIVGAVAVAGYELARSVVATFRDADRE